MKKSLFISALVLTVFVIPKSVFAFDYKVPSYPRTEGQTCFQTAQQVAAKFKEAAMVEVTSSVCEKYTKETGDLLITYSSFEPVVLQSTRYAGLSEIAGGFLSQESCNAAINEERDRFIDATGLNPFISYCYKSDGDNGLWDIVLEAVGTSDVSPRMSGFTIDRLPLNETEQGFVKKIETELRTRNVALSYVAIRNYLAYYRLSFRYYAEDSLSVEHEAFSNVQTIGSCETNVNLLKNIFEKISSDTLSIHCAPSNAFTSTYQTVALVFGEKKYRNYDIEGLFASFETCEAGKQSAILEFERESGIKIIGGICSRDMRSLQYRIVGLSQL